MSTHTPPVWYGLQEPESIASPALLVYRERLTANIDAAIERCGAPERFRPHVKTHKSAHVVGLHIERGVKQFKCATIREAEMIAEAGADDILLAYQPVGPGMERVFSFCRQYPHIRFSCLVDNAASLDSLEILAEHRGTALSVYIDLDVGMHRTGIAPGTAADELYRRAASARWLEIGGIHAYDGHIKESDFGRRGADAAESRNMALSMRARMLDVGLPVPELVLGGTPTFPCHADAVNEMGEETRGTIRLSPGTYPYADWGYSTAFPDLPFQAAALVLGRVIGVPEPGRFTIDVGSKAIAADPPQPRGTILNLPAAAAGPQSEEHWVFTIEPGLTPSVGTAVYVWPKHICTTVAHYDKAACIGADGRLIEWWPVTARGR
jgi:3-hydroxy-D-aspartate aldolase